MEIKNEINMLTQQDITSILGSYEPVSDLSDVILETDLFTRSVDINDTSSSSQSVCSPAGIPSGLEDFLLPEKDSSPSMTPSSNQLPFTLTNWNTLTSNSRVYRGPSSDGLDTIPEHEVTQSPSIYQPFVPPPVNVPSTTSYNISFPTTLQPRENLNSRLFLDNEKSGTPSNKRSGTSYHTTENGTKQDEAQDNDDARSVKSNKRSRRSTPNGSISGDIPELLEDLEQPYEEKRNRKKCIAPISSGNTEMRRRDSIKLGLDELQRVLPHLGTPEEEKISHASVLHEAGKFIKNSLDITSKTSNSIQSLKQEIETLNRQIENFQSQLPDNGVVLVPKVLASRSLADRFHDHVVEKTLQDWRYWVFTNIMGHFVHSFDREVDASSIESLKATSSQWTSANMSLHLLRKDAYRKLAKLCAKTSIVDNPSKLSEEALGFVLKRDRLFNSTSETVPDNR